MDTLTHDQLKTVIDAKADFELINVLNAESFEQQHIPGSENIPVDNHNFERQVQRLVGGKERPVVVYGTSFDCDASRRAAQKLEEAGFTDVYDYEGGTEQWKEAGYAIEHGWSHARSG